MDVDSVGNVDVARYGVGGVIDGGDGGVDGGGDGVG